VTGAPWIHTRKDVPPLSDIGSSTSYDDRHGEGKAAAVVDLVMDLALAANEAARDPAVARACADAERAAARVIAASGFHIPAAGNSPEGCLVNPVAAAHALSQVGLLCTPPIDPGTVIAAELVDVAARRGDIIREAMARIVARGPDDPHVLIEVYNILSSAGFGFALPDATVARMTTPSADDKAHIRHHLNLDAAEWIRADAEGVDPADCLEYAFITHTDGVTYTAMRKASGGDVLVFTPGEWDAFVKGARDGEFEQLADGSHVAG